MIPIRYLKEIKLYKVTETRSENGALAETFTLSDTYYGQIQEIADELSASLYGTSIDKMLRVSTPYSLLEKFLGEKVSPTTGNVTEYIIVMGSVRYRIVRVRMHWVDIEMVGTFTTNEGHQ